MNRDPRNHWTGTTSETLEIHTSPVCLCKIHAPTWINIVDSCCFIWELIVNASLRIMKGSTDQHLFWSPRYFWIASQPFCWTLPCYCWYLRSQVLIHVTGINTPLSFPWIFPWFSLDFAMKPMNIFHETCIFQWFSDDFESAPFDDAVIPSSSRWKMAWIERRWLRRLLVPCHWT